MLVFIISLKGSFLIFLAAGLSIKQPIILIKQKHICINGSFTAYQGAPLG